jgi:hypothetical protein
MNSCWFLHRGCLGLQTTSAPPLGIGIAAPGKTGEVLAGAVAGEGELVVEVDEYHFLKVACEPTHLVF